ncbi:MAG: discoidin domain-containing protein [Verrucomicrobiae bacterium]|nr:discoidin domain-containing protein [Verrucomicrobiae bacterium]
MRTLTLLLGTLLALGAQAAEPGAERPQVLAHYLGWFENRPVRGDVIWEHWSYKLHGTPHDASVIGADGKRDISSVFYPLIGPYDSNDPDVLEYHVLAAKSAGIDGFVLDWYQPGAMTDVALKFLAANGAKYKFKVAACYEEKAAFPGYRNPKTRDDAVQLAISDFTYILKEYGSSPSYVRWNGKPLVLMFLGGGQFAGKEAVFDYMELAKIKEAVKSPDWILVREHVEPSFWGSARGGFEWVGEAGYHDWIGKTAGELKAKKRLDLFIPGVSPGFDSSGVSGWSDGQTHPIIDRENGEYYVKQWDRAIGLKPELVQIITWNDFQEGSVIEPTFQFGNQYLDATERMVEKFNGRKAEVSDNDLAFKLYQLRKAARKQFGPGSDEEKKIQAKLDGVVQQLVDGKGKDARQALDSLADVIGWKWLPRITPDQEFARYEPPLDPKIAQAYDLIKSPSNLARGKPVEVSASDPSAPDCRKLVDGDSTTRWASTYNEPHWVRFDLGAAHKISKLVLDWETAHAKNYGVEVSSDGEHWTSVASVKDSPGGVETVSFPSTEARYVRLQLAERSTSWGFSLWEVGIFE